MSEYQYYHFKAIDQALTERQQQQLRDISTRAEITSQYFENEYHWGDLNAEPVEMMATFFDFGFYLTNWGNAELYIKLDKGILASNLISVFLVNELIDIVELEQHSILVLSLPATEEYYFYEGDGNYWLHRILPLRDELINGDYRALILILLSAIECGYFNLDFALPILANANQPLSPCQQAIMEFFQVDLVWSKVYQNYADQHLPKHLPKQVAKPEVSQLAFIEQLAEADRNAMLISLINDNANTVKKTLIKQFRTFELEQPEKTQTISLAKLQCDYEKQHQIYVTEQALAEEKLAKERQQQREIHLQQIYDSRAACWSDVNKLADKGSGHSYNEATQLIKELSFAYELNQQEPQFQLQLTRFISKNPRKPALLKRLQEYKTRD
ncbi:hypothetical protein [Thalassotalea sp. ND16A]|uniref:hypothetical protein n=1 Tax=Thalassotalea sp. ND16A TaxID=1535422 RepID=UPI00051D8431|nr:hypothetical protein [Thalassotalea sp. ND16A]KGJ90482.1 hypothetical protein ND16A_1878 [Thalassotalea sp. ND16A]